jgi:hypothetical protein
VRPREDALEQALTGAIDAFEQRLIDAVADVNAKIAAVGSAGGSLATELSDASSAIAALQGLLAEAVPEAQKGQAPDLLRGLVAVAGADFDFNGIDGALTELGALLAALPTDGQIDAARAIVERLDLDEQDPQYLDDQGAFALLSAPSLALFGDADIQTALTTFNGLIFGAELPESLDETVREVRVSLLNQQRFVAYAELLNAGSFDFSEFKADFLASQAALTDTEELAAQLRTEARLVAQIDALRGDKAVVDSAEAANARLIEALRQQELQAELILSNIPQTTNISYSETFRFVFRIPGFPGTPAGQGRWRHDIPGHPGDAADRLRAGGVYRRLQRHHPARSVPGRGATE